MAQEQDKTGRVRASHIDQPVSVYKCKIRTELYQCMFELLYDTHYHINVRKRSKRMGTETLGKAWRISEVRDGAEQRANIGQSNRLF